MLAPMLFIPACGGNPESIPAFVAAHTLLRRIQDAWPLPRLLVLDPAWATGTIPAFIEANRGSLIWLDVRPEDTGRNRNLLRRNGRGDEEPFRPYLFHRICARTGATSHAQIRAIRTHQNFSRRQSCGHA